MSSTQKIRVVVFEDNSALRDSVQFLLNASEGFECLAAYPDTRNLLLNIGKHNPDVVIMDIEMPGMDGIEAAGLLKKHHPDIAVLMFTVFDDKEKIFQALCSGGSGYILKNSSPSQILQAVRDVYEGGTPLTASVAKRVVSFFVKNNVAPSTNFGLTAKEKQLLEHLVEGKSYKMIADAMGISLETVKSHFKNVYRKLHVSSSPEAVAKAIREKLI